MRFFNDNKNGIRHKGDAAYDDDQKDREEDGYDETGEEDDDDYDDYDDHPEEEEKGKPSGKTDIVSLILSLPLYFKIAFGFIALLFIFIIIILVSGDGGNAPAPSNEAGPDTERPAEQEYVDDEGVADTEIKSLSLRPEKEQIRCSGWSGAGSVTVDNPGVKDHVTYEVEGNGSLSNGDHVTIHARYDAGELRALGYEVVEDTVDTDYTVADLMTITSAGDFHDGVAWARCSGGGLESSAWCIVDNKGHILYTLESGMPSSDFYDGTCIIDGTYVIDKKGNTVWSCREQAVSKADEIWGKDSVVDCSILYKGRKDGEGPEEDYTGRLLIQYEIESFKYSGPMVGVVTAAGEWVLEPLSLTDGKYENGVWTFAEGSVNVEKGAFIKKDSEDYEDTVKGWKKDHYYDAHNSLKFFRLEDGSCCFRDKSGEKVIDLAEYTVPDYEDTFVSFNNGYSFVIVLNPQGSEYSILYDTEGNIISGPEKAGVTKRSYVSDDASGHIWMSEEGYKNLDGRLIRDYEGLTEHYGFSEGMARVRDNTSGMAYHFINTDGKIVF